MMVHDGMMGVALVFGLCKRRYVSPCMADRERMPLQPLVSKTSHQVPFFSHLSLKFAISAFSLQAKYPLSFKKIEK